MCILRCFKENIQLKTNFHRYVDISISAIFIFRYIDIIDTLNGVSMTALLFTNSVSIYLCKKRKLILQTLQKILIKLNVLRSFDNNQFRKNQHYIVSAKLFILFCQCVCHLRYPIKFKLEILLVLIMFFKKVYHRFLLTILY